MIQQVFSILSVPQIMYLDFLQFGTIRQNQDELDGL